MKSSVDKTTVSALTGQENYVLWIRPQNKWPKVPWCCVTLVWSVALKMIISVCLNNYPARACASKGLCDRSWCLYIIYLQKNFKLFFYLPKYSLSDTHFKTGRLLFDFNRIQYTLAAPEVFVVSANPVSLPSRYRVSIVRNTNIDQIETTPLRYCMLDTVEHAYSWLRPDI